MVSLMYVTYWFYSSGISSEHLWRVEIEGQAQEILRYELRRRREKFGSNVLTVSFYFSWCHFCVSFFVFFVTF